jgi:phage host-nuclease inhibitor protein Gam
MAIVEHEMAQQVDAVSQQDFADYQDESDPEVRGPWKVETVQDADWALSRLGECEREAAEIALQAQAAHEAIDLRAKRLTWKAQCGAAFFTMRLLQWAYENLTEIHRGKKKSRDFLHGVIGTRKKGGHLVVKDKDALNAWVREQPPERGFFRVKVEPEMKALQDEYRKNGVVPPGMDVEPERDELYVKAIPETEAIKPVNEE